MLFKKKNKNNNKEIIFILEQKLKEAKENNQTSFYYPVLPNDLSLVKNYFQTKYTIVVEADHVTNNIIFYKFYGF